MNGKNHRVQKNSIPKMLHFIWFQGWEKRPEFGKIYTETWISAHPDWKVCTWDEHSLVEKFGEKMGNNMISRIASLPEIVQKVDVWRLIILKYIGGVYVDLDFVCLTNIEKYLDGYTFVASVEHDDIIANGFIAATSEHKMINDALDYLMREGISLAVNWPMSFDSKRYVLETTGPHAISPVWRESYAQLSNEEKKVVKIETDTNVFFPMKYSEYDVSQTKIEDIEILRTRYKESIAVHMYWGSWTYNKGLFV